MSVARRFGKSATVADLSPRILYELAAPSTSDEVAAKIEAKAEAGVKVSLEEVKALKRAAAVAETDLRSIRAFGRTSSRQAQPRASR